MNAEDVAPKQSMSQYLTRGSIPLPFTFLSGFLHCEVAHPKVPSVRLSKETEYYLLALAIIKDKFLVDYLR